MSSVFQSLPRLARNKSISVAAGLCYLRNCTLNRSLTINGFWRLSLRHFERKELDKLLQVVDDVVLREEMEDVIY